MSCSINAQNEVHANTRVISISSGKGGVGKSTMVANFGATLGRMGKKVLLLDGDLGMANLDIMMGIRSGYTLNDVIFGNVPLIKAIVEVEPNVYLIPGGSGVYELPKISNTDKQNLMDQISQLPMSIDYFLIDTAPGIDDNVLFLNSAASEIIILITPDPASLTDAYALIKVLNSRCREYRFSIIPNLVQDEKEALLVFKAISDVADKFLCVSLDYRGFVPMDLSLKRATRSQQLVINSDPRSQSAKAIGSICEKINGYTQIQEAKGGMQFFWRQMVGLA